MSSSNENNIPQVQQKGFFAAAKDAMGGATQVANMIGEFRPILTDATKSVEVASQQIADLSASAQEMMTRVDPVIDEVRQTMAELSPEVKKTTQAVQSVAATFQELGNSAQEILGISKNVATNAESVLEKLNIAFTPVQITILGKDIYPILKKVCRIIVNFSMARDGARVASFIFNAIAEFGEEIGVLLKNLIFTERNTAESVPPGVSQMLGDFSEVQNWLSEHKALTVTGLASALAMIFQYALGFPPDLSNIEKSIKFFGDRCRGLKSIADFGRSSWSMFESIAEWILSNLFPGMHAHAMDEYLADYGRWASEVRGLHSADNPFHVRVKKDKSLIYRVEKLYRQGLKFSIALGKMQIPPQMRDHYQKHWKLILDYQKVADYSGVLGNKPRPKPLIVHLFGESGVGKSGATWPLASDFNAAVSDDILQASDIAAEIYFRNVEQEFWDGYAAQNVCVYDDFGQRSDTSAKPNEEYMELVRVGNVAAYPLHMAELQEKSRTKFTSKFVILTSNTIDQKVSSLTFPSAYRRRIDVCAKVEVKMEYAKEGYNADTQANVMRLDPAKCKGACDTDPYLFILYNPETKQPICENGAVVRMEYEAFLEHCLKMALASFDKSYSFNDALSSRIDESRFQRLKRLIGQAQKEPVPTGTSQSNEEDSDEVGEYFVVEQASQIQYELANSHAAAEKAPLLKRTVKKFIEIAKGWFTLKSVLALVGAVLGGLSVWKLFKMTKARFSEKPQEKTEIKTIASEALFSNHRSKAVSKALRHQMRSIDGFHPIDSVLHHLRVLKMTREELLQIVKDDKKNRFMVQGDQIRANQGHSYEIDPSKIFTPATIGWATHFTHEASLDSIKQEGILRMNRDWVHLYPGIHTKLPAHFSGRSAFVHVDLSRCGGEVWETVNGYIHVKEVPVGAITATGKLATGVIEATSGDNLTAKNKTIVTEQTSGDNKTLQIKKIATEASCSADNTTRKLQRVVTEMVEGQSEMWADKSAQELITYRILNNEYRIETDGISRLNGLFVRDTVMLTCQHLMRVLVKAKEMRIWNMRGSEFTVPVSALKFQVLTTRDGEDKDAMLIQFPRYVNGHSDLVKHFQKMPELSSRRADVCLPMIRTMGDQNLFYILGNMTATMDTSQFRELVDGVEHIRTFRDSLRYKANTTNGDCGAPVIVNDNSFIRKIAGIHSSALTDGSGVSIGQSVTQADLQRGFAQLGDLIIQDADELPNIAVPTGVVQFEQGYSVESLIERFNLPGPTFGHVGTCTKVVRPPGQTDLRPSAMYGYVTPTTKPAFLWHKDHNLVHKNVGKNALNTPFIPKEEVDRAVAEVRPLLLSGDSRKRLAKIYSFEEAVAGSSDSEYITGIARQTSPGYPWVLERVSGAPGKTTWFGTDEWIFPEEIKEIVLDRINNAKQGKRLPVVWSDTLKDERRPIEKVNALKTRVFSHGPMDYTIAVRMYYIGFVAHIMENRIDNEQSIGSNPFGPDWGRTAKKLGRFGDKVFAGDFSQFDGTLNSCILERFADVANDFYNDGPENALVRKTLLADVYNSIHLCDGEYIQLTHSQPSGNPLTTILNSFYNSVSMRIAYYRCFNGVAPPFSQHVSMVSYGDDNVINLSAAVAEVFNQRTVTEAYSTFGMIYTDESKSEGEVEPWRKITEVAYLKRAFRKEYGEWMAPLAMETILESCNWIRKCPDPVEALRQNVEGAFRELSHHEEQVFDATTKFILEAFYDRTDIYPELKTRLSYLQDETPAW